MTKLFVALCALATLSLVACKKGEETPTPNHPNNPAQQYDTREGAYDPVGKIVAVTYSDDTPSEEWVWENGKLQRVNNDVLFTYRADGRVDQVEIQNIQTGGLLPIDGLGGTMAVSYSGDYISALSVMNDGTEALTVQVQHNSAKKISGATIDLSDNVLLDLFNSMLAQFMPDSTGSDNFATAVDNVTGNVSFSWNGDNVNQALLNIGFRVATTVGTLVNLIGEENLSSMFGENGSMLALAASMFPNQPLYFNVTVGDTVDYTYDNKVNPFHHYLGRLHISALTANNVLSEEHTGNAHVTITTSLGGSNMQLYETDYPLPLEPNYYEYLEYNAKGCPLRMVNADYVETDYQYRE